MTTGTYDKTVADLVKLRADDGRAAAQKNATLEAEVYVLEGQWKDANEHLAALVTEPAGLRKKLDDAAALAGEFRSRLETLAQNVDKLTSEKGQLGRGSQRRGRDSKTCGARRPPPRRARRPFGVSSCDCSSTTACGPGRWGAAGYGEVDPLFFNDSTGHRAQNRRLDIVLQPNLADLLSTDNGSAGS